jgi:hypothetical protein
MTQVTVNSSSVSAVAEQLIQQSSDLRNAVERQWKTTLQDAAAIPTFSYDVEPDQFLTDIIPNLSDLLALREAVGLRLAIAINDLSDGDQQGQQGFVPVRGPR